MGWLALRLQTHVTRVETGNKWFRKQIREWLHMSRPGAVLPTIRQSLWKFLKNYGQSGQLPEIPPTKYRRPSGPEKTGQKHFLATMSVLATMRAHESAVVKLNRNAGEHTFFAWKQKTRYGPLYPVTAQQANKVAAMWGLQQIR